MAIDSHNTNQAGGAQLNTQTNSQTNSQSAIQPQQTGASPLSGGLRGVGAWAVDAACSGNPGPMEYQCVDLQTGARVFHFGPVMGTNNIGEFLAIVHALALMEKTTFVRNAETEELHQIIARAEHWLQTHKVTTPIIKWETKQWGEIPADFGRK